MVPDATVQLTREAQTPEDAAAQAALARRGPLPVHIACIMDGNGRWAKARGKRRASGHREGVESVRVVTEACAQLGVGHLTLYTFSTENWARPPAEDTALMELLVHTVRREAERLDQNDIRLHAIGDLDRLPRRCRRELEEAIALTADNRRMTLNLALSYSGRWEIARAARRLAAAARDGRLDPDALTEETVAAALDTAGLPDPDLLIRTGGEMRVSNFLLWQIAYTELHVTDCLWPDFRREALYAAIRDYQDRDRRFGRVAEAEGPREPQ
ncbi:MAG: isoprenyl transferase [Rubricoccaceae bacterium]|nr:isoprenyl transferase [Rubricoccaceae bacterium]